MKIAVVTPYWQESPDVLDRCLMTVRQQTLPATHYLVADGNPRELPAGCTAVHLVLPENVGNYGATPRGLGTQLAFNDGHDVVACLDADNWLEPEHLERAASLLERESLDVVFARRTIVFPDGERLTPPDPHEPSHVDTNCYVISGRAAFLAAAWAMLPREFGSGEDRVILQVIRHLQLRTAWLDSRTVWYETNNQNHYTLAGKQPVQPVRQLARRVSSHFDPERYFHHTGIKLPFARAPMAEVVTERPPNQWRVAVITPYRGESREALLRCAASVAIQGGEVVHYVVSDAETPCPADIPKVRHFILPGARDDYGNTARGLGAILAFQLGFDAVAFLDATAWYKPDHLPRVLHALTTTRAALAVCIPPEGVGKTSSYLASAILISRKASYLGAMWAQLPELPTEERNAHRFMQIAASRRVPTAHITTGSIGTDYAHAQPAATYPESH